MKKQELDRIIILKQRRRELDNYTCGYCRKTNCKNVVLMDPMLGNGSVLSTTRIGDLTTVCRQCCALIVNYAYRKWPLTSDIATRKEAERRAINYRKYTDYISGSKKWEQLRQARITHDNSRCVNCNTAKNLQVHHNTYDRLFNENLDDLITLCRRCHKRLHDEEQLRKAGLL